MKFTVIFTTLLSISWAVKVNPEDPKDKREAPLGYPGSGGGHHSFASPSFSHDGANSVSIGAGYSVGGNKPSYIYEAPDSGISSENLHSSGHASIQLPPITLQQSQGNLASSDLSQLMSELSHGLNTGSLTISHYQAGDKQSPQDLRIPQYTIGEPKLQYAIADQPLSSVPSYAAGTKGLGSYAATGPVLFAPVDSKGQQPTLNFGSPGISQYFGEQATLSLGGSGESGHGYTGYSLGEPAPSFGVASAPSYGGSSLHGFGGSGISLGSSGHSLGSAGHSYGGSGHPFSGSIKGIGSTYVLPAKTSFKPSTYLGPHSDSSHGLFSLSGSYGAPAFGQHSNLQSGSSSGIHSLSIGHGPNPGSSISYGGGPSKFIAHTYTAQKSKGSGPSGDSVAYSSSHPSPPRTTYGHPAGSSYPGSSSGSSHASPTHGSQYYISSTKYTGFGDGNTSFKGLSSAPSSLASLGPKYNYGHSTSRFAAPKDTHGSFSENSYNTIKYSEELKPRVQVH